MEEHVVLVDEQNNVLGTAPKLATHSSDTPLHRGFSLFLFTKEGKLLLQQRSHLKKTWPLVWSNSVCGHPMENEPPLQAAKRRLHYELGILEADVFMVLPTYRYRYERDGIVENEICPVMIGFSNDQPQPNAAEVEAIEYVTWEEWLSRIKRTPQNFSEWAIEETTLLNTSSLFHNLLKEHTSTFSER